MPPEFSRPLRADAVRPGDTHAITATAPECAALAARLAIPALASLTCRYRLTPQAGGAVLAEGELRARLTRVCVVSLEEFATTHAESFRLRFVPAGAEAEDDDPEADDEITYEAGLIDLGEAAAEQLGLGLDPYPRAPGAAMPVIDDDEARPFAALARLRKPS